MKKNGEKKTDPLFKNFMDIYFKWMKEERGVPPIVNGREGKALNSIIKYLRTQSGDEEEITGTWIALLGSYHRWDNFHQKNIKISGIETNLINIVHSIKNGKKSITEAKSLAEQRAEIGNLDD